MISRGLTMVAVGDLGYRLRFGSVGSWVCCEWDDCSLGNVGAIAVCMGEG